MNTNIRLKKIAASFFFLSMTVGAVMAGNEDRAGSAGGTQLLINPWARNSALAGSNVASSRGIEATFNNVAGLAFTEKTEFVFSRARWLEGSNTNINSFGFSQKVGEVGVLGLSLVTVDFGEIPVTTTNNPEGGIGTFSPNNANIGLSYAKKFSDRIFAGVNVKLLSESISNAKAQGVALDAGVRYITGDRDQFRFGISLKNVGPPMQYGGDGFSFETESPNGNNIRVDQRVDEFEIPSLINIGLSYDFKLPKNHGLTASGTFTSNSFTRDQFRLGANYIYKDLIKVKMGYLYEDKMYDDSETQTVFSGFTGGAGVRFPMGKEKNTFFELNYSYRSTNPFSGVHTIGIRADLH
ncbi:MAG: PorV/PorQ family protein [Flavobacteriales bacterium]